MTPISHRLISVLFWCVTTIVLIGWYNVGATVFVCILLGVDILISGMPPPADALQIFWGKLQHSRLSPRALRLYHSPVTVTVESGGIRTESGYADVLWRWEAMDRVLSTDGGIILIAMNAPFTPSIYVPRHAFADQDEMKAFHAECNQRIHEALGRDTRNGVP